MGFCYPFSELDRLYLDPEIRLAILSLYEQLNIGAAKEVSDNDLDSYALACGVAWQSGVKLIQGVELAPGEDSLNRKADVQLQNGVEFRVSIERRTCRSPTPKMTRILCLRTRNYLSAQNAINAWQMPSCTLSG